MKRRGPIPSEIDLGSVLLHVRLVSKSDMIKALDGELEVGPNEAVEGLWDPDLDTIFIGKWLPRKVQRWVLFHELVHAAIDLRDRFEKE